MNLRSAALLAFVGMALLTVMLLFGFARDVTSFLHDLIPAIRLFSSAIYLFASLALTIFLWAFRKSTSKS